MKHSIRLAALLFGLWLGLSGSMEALLLALGVASTVLVVVITHRMDRVDGERHAAHIPIRLVQFWIYLLGQIVIANLRVIRCIVMPGKTISPQVFNVPLPQKSDLGQVIYANSITLTPGTVSLRFGAECLLVHALTREAAELLLEGEMARRVPDFPPEENT